MKYATLKSTRLDPKNYRGIKRVIFLFSALSTRSSIAVPMLQAIGSKRANLDALWIESNQARSETELKVALERYSKWPIRSLRSMDRVNLAILASRLGERALAEASVRGMKSVFAKIRGALPKTMASVRYQSINEGMNVSFAADRDYSVSLGFLRLDVKNPFRAVGKQAAKSTPAQQAKWVRDLGRELLPPRTGKLVLAEGSGTPFDRLNVTELPATNNAHENLAEAIPLVTVVVSTFQPGQQLAVSVRSILAQTYQNLEILVIDDASGSAFDDVLESVANLDDRVFVLRQKVNGGTYRIRNRALDEATGELITFHDSDDWMHPMRIQLHVEHLLKHNHLMSNISASTRITDNLEAAESNRHLRVGLCEPALMFRREAVKAKIGYFDSVRKGGDVEYRRRLDRAFGQKTAVVRPWYVLTLQRTDNGGLTEGELGYRWIAPFRTLHRDSFVLWQKRSHQTRELRIERDSNLAAAASSPESRLLYAPRQILEPRKLATSARKLDLVIAADFGDAASVAKAHAEIVAELAEHPKAKIAILACQSLIPLKLNRSVDASIIELLNAQTVTAVYPQDHLAVKRLSILSPSAFVNSQQAAEFVWKVAEAGYLAGHEAWMLDAEDEELAIGELIGELLER